jgi:hypothetical protein
MRSRRVLFASFVVLSLTAWSQSVAQTPSALYSFDGTPGTEEWIRAFGSNTVTLDNGTAGQLTITETGTDALAGTGVAISDGFNRVRESSTASGGLDLTGLDFLEFDLGHNGAGSVPVQFYVQATPASAFRALGPDLAVTPGVNAYRVPLTGLAPEERVYLRTLGFNARDHVALGNLTWTLNEVRSAGTPLAQRTLVTHDTGTAEGGLQGALVNFDGGAVQGNTGQDQTGLSHNPAGSGSLQWTDLGGGPGGAISWGNGTAWNGNTFNNRTTDLSNYGFVTISISATDPANGGGTVGVQQFFQTGPGFTFRATGLLQLPIDGQFHELTFPLAGLTDMNVVDTIGINLAGHPQTLTMNVDSIRFDVVPEPASGAVLALAAAGTLALTRRRHARG